MTIIDRVVYSPVVEVVPTPLRLIYYLSRRHTLKQASSRFTIAFLIALLLIFTDDLNPFPESKHRSYDVFPATRAY
jgi:hypothetical protein